MNANNFTGELDPTKKARNYAAGLNDLSHRGAGYDFLALSMDARSDRDGYTAQENGRQTLPLNVTVDDTPMSVLFTVSIGGTRDENGRYKQIATNNLGGPDGVTRAVQGAGKTYAIVRKSYSDGPGQLIELTQNELETGFSNITAEESATRMTQIPPYGETSLQREVPVGFDEEGALSATMSFTMEGNNLYVNRGGDGERDAYVMVAAQM